MATVLHLVQPRHATLVGAVVEGQVAAGDEVTVALLGGARADFPPAARVHRVPEEVDYAALLGLVWAADHVVTW